MFFGKYQAFLFCPVLLPEGLNLGGCRKRYARKVRLENIEVMERRATLLIDVARAYQQWGKTDQAYQVLRNVEDMASEELSARPTVHQLINDIRSRASTHLYRSVSELAERAGA